MPVYDQMDSSLSTGVNTLSQVGSTFATDAVGGMAGLIASSATRSLINGTDFGDNILKGLPDAIGQTIGNMVAGEIESPAASDEQTDFDQAGKYQLQPPTISPIQFNANDLKVSMPLVSSGPDSDTTADEPETAGHKIIGTPSAHGMPADDRLAALDTQMSTLGATKNADGSYSLDGDTIKLDNRYVLDKPKPNAGGGLVFDPDTVVYKDTRGEANEFLANILGMAKLTCPPVCPRFMRRVCSGYAPGWGRAANSVGVSPFRLECGRLVL